MPVALGEAVSALGQGWSWAPLELPLSAGRLAGLGHCCPLSDRGEKQFQFESSFFPFVVDVEAVPSEPFSEIVLLLFSTDAIA